MFNSSAFVLAFAIAAITGFALQMYEDYKEVIARDEEER
jgi:hypothetical protein